MTGRQPDTDPHQRWWLGAAGLLGLALAVAMAVTWPHNGDESFNYLFYARRGIGFILTDYTYANNHILFSVVQALIPGELVDRHPLLVRGPNILISAGLVAVLTAEVRRSWDSLVRVLALVFAGPWSIVYFAVARGYQLGSLLVAAALLVAARYNEQRWAAPAAAAVMALAVWTVPTFAYGAPILAVAYGIQARWWEAVRYSAVFAAMSLAFYGPVLGDLFGERIDRVNEALPFGEYTASVVDNFLFVPLVPALALVGVALAGLGISARALARGRDTTATMWSFLLVGYVLTFLVTNELITTFSDTSSPFLRNASFVAPFVAVGIWLAPLWRHRWLRVGVIILLAFNVVLGINTWIGVSSGADVATFAGTSVRSTPALGVIAEDDSVAEVRCAVADSWNCQLYRDRFEAASITLTLWLQPPETVECTVGTRPPRPPGGVEAIYLSGERGLVCFG